MKASRRVAPLLCAPCLCLVATPAWAWVETHLVSDEVRIEVERSGGAVIDHAITMRVQGGPLRSFDIAVGDAAITPLGDGSVISAQSEGLLGLPIPLAVSPRPDGALRINIDSPRGVSRGTFLFHVRYRKNLLTGDNIRRDGAMLRLRFMGPAWQEGLDNASATFVLPPAPTEPRPGNDQVSESGEDDPGFFVSRVKRSADRDEVELIRPHVARGEAVAWTTRIDPRALGEVNDPRLRALPPPPVVEVAMEERIAYIACAALLLVGFSLLVAQKARQVARHAEGVARPRPLIPWGSTLRTVLAGPALTAGVALQLFSDEPYAGTALLLFAMALTWYRQPEWKRKPRGPGRWLPMSDAEAFARPPAPANAWLDASTRRGGALFAAALGCAGALIVLASRFSSYAAYLVLFDSAVLVPLFGTGRLRDLPAHPVHGPGATLRRIAEQLRKRLDVRILAWGRLPEGGNDFDELRLLCAPKLPRRGFVGIEVGVVGVTGLGGAIRLPEVLVRVIDASPCHEAFRTRLPRARWVRGRKSDERVTSLAPRLPTLAMTAALASRLIECALDDGPQQGSAPPPPGGSGAGRGVASELGKHRKSSD